MFLNLKKNSTYVVCSNKKQNSYEMQMDIGIFRNLRYISIYNTEHIFLFFVVYMN